jgi:hypothetical protein
LRRKKKVYFGQVGPKNMPKIGQTEKKDASHGSNRIILAECCPTLDVDLPSMSKKILKKMCLKQNHPKNSSTATFLV